MSITVEELQAEVERLKAQKRPVVDRLCNYLQGHNPCYLTTDELCLELGCGETALARSLRALKSANKITIHYHARAIEMK